MHHPAARPPRRAGTAWARRLSLAGQIGVLVIGVAFAACSLLGIVWAPADSINLVAVWWLPALTGGLAAVALWSRWPGLRLVAGLLVVCLAGLAVQLVVWPVLARDQGVALHGGEHLRVVSFNMYKDNPDPQRVAQWIISTGADVVVVLEAVPQMDGAAGLQAAYPYHYACAPSGRCSTRVYARFPARSVQPLARGDPDRRRALSALVVSFPLEQGEFTLAAAHLPRPWPQGTQRPSALELQHALARRDDLALLLGDFNSAPSTHTMRSLAQAARVRLATQFAGTWPARGTFGIRLPLDQVYHGRCTVIDAVTLGPDLGSDHLPLVIDLRHGDCNG